jgi:transcription antitermination factor NusG
MDQSWYIISTKPGKERKAATALTRKGIESFCPFNKITNQDNKWQESRPLFSSCVFVHITESEIGKVKNTPYVDCILYYKSSYAVIMQQEIDVLKQAISSFVNITLKKTMVDSNGKITISDITMVNYGSLKITLPSMGYTLVAEKGRVKPERPLIMADFRKTFPINLMAFLTA